MGAAGPANPQGRSASGGPERTSFLERSGREEARAAGGEKTWPRRFRQGTGPPIGLRHEQGNGIGDRGTGDAADGAKSPDAGDKATARCAHSALWSRASGGGQTAEPAFDWRGMGAKIGAGRGTQARRIQVLIYAEDRCRVSATTKCRGRVRHSEKGEAMAPKAGSSKTIHICVYKDGGLWNVQFGELKRHKGNPGKTEHLFRVVGEKLPYEALSAVRKHVKEQGFGTDGVYIAHDSMGFPRYIGRGAIFTRL